MSSFHFAASRKSLNKLNGNSHEYEVHQDSSSSLTQRKQNNSWLAQSFRKAFAKIENKKKPKNAGKMVSSLSVNNCVDNCPERSLSDDEEQTPSQKRHAAKLSLLPSTSLLLQDTDSDFEEEKQGQNRHKNSSLITKRSFRSESELISKQQQQNPNQSNNLNISPNSAYNEPVSHQKPTNLSRNNSKLSKTHKSVNSLLSTGNEQNQQNSAAKLLEINQAFNKNQAQIGRSQCSGLNSPGPSHHNKWFFFLSRQSFFI